MTKALILATVVVASATSSVLVAFVPSAPLATSSHPPSSQVNDRKSLFVWTSRGHRCRSALVTKLYDSTALSNDEPVDLKRAIHCAESPGECSLEEILALTQALERSRGASTSDSDGAGMMKLDEVDRNKLEENLLNQLYLDDVLDDDQHVNREKLEEDLVNQYYVDEAIEETSRVDRSDWFHGRNDLREMIKEEHLHVIDLKEEMYKKMEDEGDEALSDWDVAMLEG